LEIAAPRKHPPSMTVYLIEGRQAAGFDCRVSQSKRGFQFSCLLGLNQFPDLRASAYGMQAARR